MKFKIGKFKIAWKNFVLISLPLVILVWLVTHFFYRNSYIYEDDQSSNPIKVKAVKVNYQKTVNTLAAIGSLFAKQSVYISPEIAGRIESIFFSYGQTVKKNQPLYQLDDQIFQAQYMAVQSDLQLSELTYQRNLKLMRQNAVPKQALDKAQSEYKDKESDLKVLQVKLNKMLIKAPFSGVIGASKVDAGQYVSVGAPLVKLVDKAHLIAKFNIPEQYLDQVKIGQQVTIHSSAFPNKIFSGVVSYVSPTIGQDSRAFIVWASISNPDFKLAPGLFVRVRLTLGEKRNVILIPQESLIPTIEGNDVFIIKNDKAYRRSIKISQMIGDKAEIIKGIQPGDTVVTLGQEKLAEGRSVRVVSQ